MHHLSFDIKLHSNLSLSPGASLSFVFSLSIVQLPAPFKYHVFNFATLHSFHSPMEHLVTLIECHKAGHTHLFLLDSQCTIITDLTPVPSTEYQTNRLGGQSREHTCMHILFGNPSCYTPITFKPMTATIDWSTNNQLWCLNR